jgi:hypothetical protein
MPVQDHAPFNGTDGGPRVDHGDRHAGLRVDPLVAERRV